MFMRFFICRTKINESKVVDIKTIVDIKSKNEKLYEDILISIMQFLSQSELIISAQISRDWSNAIRTDFVWRPLVKQYLLKNNLFSQEKFSRMNDIRLRYQSSLLLKDERKKYNSMESKYQKLLQQEELNAQYDRANKQRSHAVGFSLDITPLILLLTNRSYQKSLNSAIATKSIEINNHSTKIKKLESQSLENFMKNDKNTNVLQRIAPCIPQKRG